MAIWWGGIALGRWAAWLCGPCSRACCGGPRRIARPDAGGGSPEPGDNEQQTIDVEVRLMSGQLKLNERVATSSKVQSLLRAASDGKAGHLLLLDRVLDPSDTLQAAGVCSGDALTLVLVGFSWDGAKLGSYAKLDADGRTVRRLGGYSNALVVASVPSRRFRFTIVHAAGHWSGAFEIGFTEVAPAELAGQLPAVASELPRSWIMGNAGDVEWGSPSLMSVDEAPAIFPRGNWHAALKPGDVVECAIAEAQERDDTRVDGRFCVSVNGKLELARPLSDAGLALGRDMYPVVSLYGVTEAVLLLDD